MTRFEHHLTRAGRGTLALLTLLCLVFTTGFGTHHPASPVERPFRGTYQGNLTVPADDPEQHISFTVTGTATHLGNFELAAEGDLYLSDLKLINGLTTFTAANGDELHTEYFSQGEIISGDRYKVTGSHIIRGGTGRFTGATGSFETISYARLYKTSETVTIAGKVDMYGTITY